MRLTDKQIEIMASEGHLLVTGGPGSGKTTISILKASQIAERDLRAGEKVLFPSFARASVSRVIQAIEYEQEIPQEVKRRIEVETYHSFFWRILRAHGYLIGLPRTLTILTPQAVAISLSAIRGDYAKTGVTDAEKTEKRTRESAEKLRLSTEEGKICFDLFAEYAGEILQRSARVRKLMANMYPFIILDEFQDTNAGQWRVVRELGRHISLLALADPEQRIYDWIGADPERLNHFKEAFTPLEADLSNDNHRSGGTDIATFANDMLAGKFRAQPYAGIEILPYTANENQAYTALMTATYRARRRLADSGKRDWSLAVLVPTKKMTQAVSDIFREPLANMKEIRHTAVVEMDAAILGAQIIAFLMQPDIDGSHFEHFLDLMCNYFHGKGGDTITKGDLKTSENIKSSFAEWCVRQSAGKAMRGNSILVNILSVYETAMQLKLCGDADKDWLAVRRILSEGTCVRLKDVAQEVRNVRLLERGTQLRQGLSQDWRDNGCYLNALDIIRQAFLQEHFSSNVKPETGVVVMNMHKAKGKAFDEVIIFEGWPRVAQGQIVANLDRIVQSNLRENITAQSQQNFRVSITRARQRTLILTPQNDPCVLLPRRALA
jgi:DNA helicase-2/ATP-dependent DNA helicase PcrA